MSGFRSIVAVTGRHLGVYASCKQSHGAVRYFAAEAALSLPNLVTGRKRFYKHVTVAPAPSDSHPGCFRILLDGRELKTPAKNKLYLPNLPLATAIACEWDAQVDRNGIQPATMPLMTLACTAIDQVSVSADSTKDTCLKYLPTDSALFFTHDDDRILLKKQNDHYRPVIRWFKRTLDVEFETSQCITSKLKHPAESVDKITRIVNSMDPFSLTCLQAATKEFKSLTLAIAYFARFMNLDEAEIIARIEEEFQVEIWGLVEGGHDMDRLNCSAGLGSVGVFLGLLHDHSAHQKIIQSWKHI